MRNEPVRSILQPGDHLERYGDAIYLTTPGPQHPKGRRIWYVITVERIEPPNVERIVSVEGFDPLKHDHH